MDDENAIFIAYVALVGLAVIPIIIGSFMSVYAPAKKEDKESLSANDAYMFPVYGSGVLAGLYLLIRFLNKEYLDLLFNGYFAIFGCGSLLNIADKLFRSLLPSTLLGDPLVVKVTHKEKEYLFLSIDWLNTSLLVISSVFTGVYMVYKNWIMSNIFGLCFSVSAISLLSLDSFKTGIILLSGLFAYDIFWVFGTDVMVTVAKSFDIPIKILFPRNIFAAEYKFSLLGLGDIVIPGIYVALCLRFDHYLATIGKNKQFSKPYFNACFLSYVAGLATTMYVMHTFKAAQPALLYLSPSCILSSIVVALVRGELKDLFAFDPENEETKEVKEEKKERDEKKEIKKERDEKKEIKKERDGSVSPTKKSRSSSTRKRVQ